MEECGGDWGPGGEVVSPDVAEVEEVAGELGVLGLEDDLDNEDGDVEGDEYGDHSGFSGERSVCSQGDEHRGWYALDGIF